MLDLLMKIQRRTDYLDRMLQPAKTNRELDAAIERELAGLTPEEGQAVRRHVARDRGGG